jgi:pimeloyl-ACP methyl ester carboxylesterase
MRPESPSRLRKWRVVIASVPHKPPAYATANGLDIGYETFGDPNDAPVLLVMGLATQMIMWDDEFCAALARQGRYVIRFDNRDIGLSTKIADARVPNTWEILRAAVTKSVKNPPYLLRDMATDTVGLMDALGIARADVVGISMGGMIGQELVMNHRERVRSFVCIMSSSGNPKLPLPKPGAFMIFLKRPPKEREAFLDFYVDLWSTLSGPKFPIDRAHTRAQGAIAYSRGVYSPGSLRQLVAIVGSGNRKPLLGSVTTPTLILHGTGDPLVRPAAAYDLLEAIPGARLQLLDDMGHTLPRALWPTVLGAIDAHLGLDSRHP